jgi:allantoinase
LTGRELQGWFSPAGSWTINTPDLVAEASIKYYCDWGHDDQRFPMRVKRGRLLTLPYQFDVNDGINFRFKTLGSAWGVSSLTVRAWSGRFL